MMNTKTELSELQIENVAESLKSSGFIFDDSWDNNKFSVVITDVLSALEINLNDSDLKSVIAERNNSEKREYDLLGKLNETRETLNLVLDEYSRTEELLVKCMNALFDCNKTQYDMIFGNT